MSLSLPCRQSGLLFPTQNNSNYFLLSTLTFDLSGIKVMCNVRKFLFLAPQVFFFFFHFSSFLMSPSLKRILSSHFCPYVYTLILQCNLTSRCGLSYVTFNFKVQYFSNRPQASKYKTLNQP